MQPTTRLLTLDNVAKRLAVSTRTIKRLTAAGRLKPVHIGRAVRWRADEVAAFIEELSGEAAGERQPVTQETSMPSTSAPMIKATV